MVGSVGVFCLSRLIEDNKLVQKIGQHTMIILIIHGVVLAMIKRILKEIDINYYQIDWICCIGAVFVVVLAGMIVREYLRDLSQMQLVKYNNML